MRPRARSNPMSKPSRAPRLLRAAALLAGLALATWLGVELLLLVFNDQVFRGSAYVYDPVLGYRVRPSWRWQDLESNSRGWNDRDYPTQRRPGSFRVLALGDSFNWAGGREGNYAGLLEAHLAEALGPGRVEVINAGFPGTHTAEQLALLRAEGLDFAPDLVLLGFFAGNDFLDAVPDTRHIAYGPRVIEVGIDSLPLRTLFGQPLLLISRIRLLLDTRREERDWQRAQATAAAQSTADAANPAAAGPPAAAGDPGAARSAALAEGGGAPGTASETAPAPVPPYPLTPQYAGIERARMNVADPAWFAANAENRAYALGHLRAMHALLAARGIPLLVVVFPDEFQVEPALRAHLAAAGGVDTSGWDWDLPQREVLRFCQAEAIECHDLLPAFRAAQAGGARLYIPNDSHWNAAGNALAAERIAALLLPRARASLAGARPQPAEPSRAP